MCGFSEEISFSGFPIKLKSVGRKVMAETVAVAEMDQKLQVPHRLPRVT